MLDVLYHHGKFGGARISGGAGAEKNVEFFCLSVCLPACLSVRHAVEHHSLCVRFRHECIGGTETISMPLNRGICVCISVQL